MLDSIFVEDYEIRLDIMQPDSLHVINLKTNSSFRLTCEEAISMLRVTYRHNQEMLAQMENL